MTKTATPEATRSARYAAPSLITPTMRIDRASRALEILEDEWFSVTEADGWATAIVAELDAGHDQVEIWALIEEFGVEVARSACVDEPFYRTVWVMPDASVITDRGEVATDEDLSLIWGDDWQTEPERLALQRVADLEGGPQ